MGVSVKVKITPISNLVVVESLQNIDNRGSFERLYCEGELADIIGSRRILQINLSRTLTMGTIRGLHFQRPPNAEMKLVRCLKGKVWDIAVDLRHDSPTFLQWHAEELTPTNSLMMVIPEGFAHGFQTLENESEIIYLHTSFYSPQSESGLRYNDPRLSINWPIKENNLSDRDASYPMINLDYLGVVI